MLNHIGVCSHSFFLAMSLTKTLKRKSSSLTQTLTETDSLLQSLQDPTQGMCACSLAGSFEESFGQHGRPQGDALPKETSWTVQTVLYTGLGAKETTTFDKVLASLPQVSADNMHEAIMKSCLHYSENAQGNFSFMLFRTTLRDVLRQAPGTSELTHESMYPLAAWHINYGFIGTLLKRDFQSYNEWYEKNFPPETIETNAKAKRLEKAAFNDLCTTVMTIMDDDIVLHVGAKPNPALRPTTTDGPGMSQWGEPLVPFWSDKGGDEAAGVITDTGATAGHRGTGSKGPYGWRILTTGKLKYIFGDMSSDVVSSLVHGSNLIADAKSCEPPRSCARVAQYEIERNAATTPFAPYN